MVARKLRRLRIQAGYRPVLPRDRTDSFAMASTSDRRGIAGRFGSGSVNTPPPDGLGKRAGHFGDDAGRGSREPTPRMPGQIGRKPRECLVTKT